MANTAVFDNAEMYVTKRNGSTEIISFDKILQRLKKIGAHRGEWTPKDVLPREGQGVDPEGIKLNYTALAIKIIDQLYDKIPTYKIDEISSEQCACLSSAHPDYSVLASRLIMSNHHKTTFPSFSKTMRRLQTNVDVNKKPCPMIATEYYNIMMQNAKALDAMCDYSRDYSLDFFAFKTLERSYLLRSKSAKVCERPQHTWLRLAVQIHGANMEKVKETYDAVSLKYFIHATPSIFNSALLRPQMSSCFVKDTMVHTLRGAVPIQEVLTTDMVITHTGSVQPVTQVHTNLLGDRRLFELNVYKTRPIIVTEDHKLYVYDSVQDEVIWSEGKMPSTTNSEGGKSTGGVWKSTADLTTSDYVMVPKNTTEIVSDTSDTQEKVNMEILKFFGIWFKYGSFIYPNPDTNIDNINLDCCGNIVSDFEIPIGISVVLPYVEEELIKFCFTEIHRMFGNVKIEKYLWNANHPQCTDGKPRIEIKYSHPPMANDFVRWFGKEKTIPSSFYQYPSTKIQYFLEGWKIGSEVSDTSRMVPVPSEIRTLCRMNNIDHVTFLPLDTLTDSSIIVRDGFVYMQVLSADVLPDQPVPETEVYTLGVENDHSYSIEGIIAQNCYLIAMESDSIDGIYNTLKDCAVISKWAGGIGLHIHNIRATGSYIAGTNGTSNGIVPMLRVFNHTAKYVDQCVHPDTIIYTTRGPKAIKNVIEGETEIFNLKNEHEVVGQVLEHKYDGEIVHIETNYTGNKLMITPEHPICIVKKSTDIENDPVEFEWIEAGKVEVSDYMVQSIPKYTKDISGLSPDDCYVYGLLLHSGSISKISLINTPLLVQKYIGDYLTNRCIQYDIGMGLPEEFGMGAESLCTTNSEGDLRSPEEFDAEISDIHRISKISWEKTTTLPFRNSDIFNEQGMLEIHHRWLHLPVEKTCIILKGIVDAGGIINKDILYETSSSALIESMRYICLRMGILCRTHISDSISNIQIPVTQQTSILFGLEYDDREPTFSRYKDNLLTPVTSITRDTYSGTLYDLQMKDQHDYLLSEGLVHNGGGKRNGSIAIYLEPWHADIEIYLQMRKNHGEEELKARDLFYAIWMPDLFMKRVKASESWTLMCPHECPGLADVWGDEFEALYTKYETEGRGRSTVLARDLWFKILDAQMETGTPYLVFKDAANRKSNQKNLGTIKSSNLCVAPETLILTDQGQIPIQALHGKYVNVWNGKEYSNVEIVQTGESQPLIEVHTNENILQCTLYHKFYIQNEDDEVVRVVEAQQLQDGDRIARCEFPTNTMEGGFLTSDQTRPATKSPPELVVKRLKAPYQFIVKVVDHGRIDDTYCFNEPLEHAGIFNGIYTSQCSEIIQYSDEHETACCNLSSIGLPSYVEYQEDGTAFYNFEKLHKVARMVTYNLNRVIDVNYYPTPKTKVSNMRHRPIGIGVQGLADTFIMMNMIFGNPESRLLNKQIFETIYHGALVESCELAKTEGAYETFPGSPTSQGLLQFDLWETEPLRVDPEDSTSAYRYDWTALKTDIVKYGLRNSLLLAPMPTASTSQILGFNECIEPITSNIFSRRTLAGEFIVTNKYLVRDLLDLGLWNEKMKNLIIAQGGSIQELIMIPEHIREKYKTVWEIPMRILIDMAADRGVYVCQSQSLNLWNCAPNYNSLTSMHFYSWSKGLKTGVYYLRTKAKSQASQFTIEVEKNLNDAPDDEDEICEMCSS
jgi:ribonucleotide reductase alpha subunit